MPEMATIEPMEASFTSTLFRPSNFIQFTDADFFHTVRIMFVDYDGVHAYSDCSVVYLADTDATYVLIVINGADQYLGIGIRVTFRSRDILKDCLKKEASYPVLRRSDPGRRHRLWQMRRRKDSPAARRRRPDP